MKIIKEEKKTQLKEEGQILPLNEKIELPEELSFEELEERYEFAEGTCVIHICTYGE